MATSYLFTTITSGATQYGQAMSALTGLLTGAGWTIQGSGDAAAVSPSFSNSGNIFVGTGTGTGGWSNVGAWIRLRDPAGVREWIFQHDNVGGTKIRYSSSAKFSGTANGAVSPTVPPTATDERYLRGASGSYGAAWFAVGATTNYYGTAKDTAPYGFWFAGSASSAIKTGLMFDPVTSTAEDTDPYVIHIGSTNAWTVNTSSLGRNGGSPGTWDGTIVNGGTTEGCFGHMSPERAVFLYLQPWSYSLASNSVSAATNNLISTTGLAVNPFNSKHDPLPFFYGKTQNSSAVPQPGLKGWSTLARWVGTSKTSLVDTLDNKNWVCVVSMWLPWDGVTTPIG